MIRNKKVTGTAKSVPAGIGIGVASALFVTLGGTFIAAWLIHHEKIGEYAIGYCTMAILMMASMLGSYIAQSLIKHKRVVMCIATGGMYYLSLLTITALFFGGQYQGMGVTALVIAAGTAVVILIGIRENTGHNRKMKKYAYG